MNGPRKRAPGRIFNPLGDDPHRTGDVTTELDVCRGDADVPCERAFHPDGAARHPDASGNTHLRSDRDVAAGDGDVAVDRRFEVDIPARDSHVVMGRARQRDAPAAGEHVAVDALLDLNVASSQDGVPENRTADFEMVANRIVVVRRWRHEKRFVRLRAESVGHQGQGGEQQHQRAHMNRAGMARWVCLHNFCTPE